MTRIEDTTPSGGQAGSTAESERTTIVFCIERGRLEGEALVMLESLRRWGGEFGRSRVLGVLPRRDRPLRRETVAALESFGVELYDASAENPMKWYNWYNKVVAARVAERVAATPVVTWMDCDILVLGPLHELGLPHGDDFAARRELGTPAVLDADNGDKHIGYWRRACKAVGVDWEAIPWLPADGPSPRQKLACNAGLYSFRRGTGFVDVYDDFTRRLNRAGVAFNGDSFWHNEQNALGLAMVSLGLRFRELPRREHHMIFQNFLTSPGYCPLTPDARLVHYSRSRDPRYWDRFMARFREEFPGHAEWLHSKGPVESERVPRDPIFLARKVYRQARARLLRRRCARVSAAWERANGGAGVPPAPRETGSAAAL